MPRLSTKTTKTRQRSTAAKRAAPTRNHQKFRASELHPRPAPAAPKVAAALLAKRESSFLEFLTDSDCAQVCDLLYGSSSSAATMLREFRKAIAGYYYG